MTASHRFKLHAITATSFALALTDVASAQNSPEVEALTKRVAELEAKLPKDAGADVMKWNDFSSLGAKFKLYGYLRVDAIRDDSRANNTQLPAYIRSEDPAAPAGFKAKHNSSDFNIHPKLTRIGLDATGPKIAALGDAQSSGKLEVDFYNTNNPSESRESPRIRLAYVQLKWAAITLFGGQMWDVISPLYPIVNPDLVMWGAGNLADRRPQIRTEWTQAMGDSKLSVTAMVGSTGALDAQDLDGNTYRDGDQSGQPTYQGRVGWKMPVYETKSNLEFGIWAHHANEETDAFIGSGGHNFVSGAYGLDVQVPIFLDRVWVKGELWHGRNLDDVRGGILQGVNSAGGEIRSTGGFGEFGVKTCDHVAVHGGYSFDDPNNDDLIGSATNAPRSRNAIIYSALMFDFKPVYFGLHYLRWTTGYEGFGKGTDNRFQLFIQYSF